MNSTRPTPTPVNLDAIPKPLTGRRQFVVCQYVLKKEEGKPDKWDKPPINARTGNPASHSNVNTWASFEEAKTAYQLGGFDGIGYVLTKEDPFFAIDLDHCFIGDETTPMARSIVERTRGYLYWEVSPSGTGLRGIGVGSIPPGRRKNAEFELYFENRYVTMTGHVFEGCDQIGGDATAIIAPIHREQFGEQQEQAERPRPQNAVPADDIEIVQRCQRLKGPKFEALMQGSTADYGGDDSRADAALIEMLLFANQGDVEQAIRIASTSMLWREKWESRRGDLDYIHLTAENMLAKMTKFYEPPAKVKVSWPSGNGNGTDSASDDDDPDAKAPDPIYRFQDGCLQHRTKDGYATVANFTAQIITDVVVDTGAEQKRSFEIEAELHGRIHRFLLPAEKYAGMAWVTEYLGASAILFTGSAAKEHARVGFQVLSEGMKQRHEFAHTGWTEIDGKQVYLTSTGAIGAAGLDTAIVVNLPGSLARYALPEPPDGQQLVDAIHASLRVIDVAPIGISGPVYCTAWRAVLGHVDFAAFISGQTGTGKSELTALIQQFFGPGMDSRHFPASWADTANAVAEVAFQVADAVLVVDDFKPVGTTFDIQRLTKDADRLIRGVGNGSGRQRMRADTTLRDAHPPRGLMLISGEDVPFGESLRSRMLLGAMKPESMDWEMLTACQKDAAAGIYAAAMAGFIQWIAADADGVEQRFVDARIRYQQIAMSDTVHKRTPRIVADLAAAYRMFLDFATNSGALTESEATQRWSAMWTALTTTATEQAAQHQQVEPTQLYRGYLASAVRSGRAHITTFAGGAPPDPDAYGWRLVGLDRQPQGERIGWIADDGMFLEPKAAYGIAQTLAQRSGESLGASSNQLSRTLREKHLLLSTDTTRGTPTIRKSIEGHPVNVLHVAPDFLDGSLLHNDKTDKTDNSSQNPSNHAGNGMSDSVDGESEERAETDKTDSKPTQGALITSIHANKDLSAWDCTCAVKNPHYAERCRCGVNRGAAA